MQTVSDMARSLGLVAACVFVLLLIGPARSLIAPTHRDQMPPVDYTEQVAAARQLAGPSVAGPAGLPAGWRATSARVTGGGRTPVWLHIGFATPGQQYAAVEETSQPAHVAFATLLGSRTPSADGVVAVAGRDWQRRRAANGELALVRSAGRVTVVVTGTADERELVVLAASLH